MSSLLITDLHRQMARYGVSYKEPLIHPQKTVTAMRLLSAIQDDTVRVSISHALYQVSILAYHKNIDAVVNDVRLTGVNRKMSLIWILCKKWQHPMESMSLSCLGLIQHHKL